MLSLTNTEVHQHLVLRDFSGFSCWLWEIFFFFRKVDNDIIRDKIQVSISLAEEGFIENF